MSTVYRSQASTQQMNIDSEVVPLY